MPQDTKALSKLRSLSDGFARSAKAAEIINAVKQGLATDMSTVPPLRQGTPLNAGQTATLELLKVLLKSAAARHNVATRLIADASDLDAIVREDEADVPALTGWRGKLFGEDALRLKRGEIALTLKGGEVQAIAVP